MIKYFDRYTIYNLTTSVLFTIGVMGSNNLILAMAVLMMCYAAVRWDMNEFINILIATVPFQSNIRFFGNNAVPLVALALLFGRISRRETSVSRIGFWYGFILLIINTVNDYSHIANWSLISWLSMVVICIYAICEVDIENCCTEKMILNFGICVCLAILANLLGMDVEGSGATVYRFGSADKSLGGAMGIPLYVLLLTSFLTAMLITRKYKSRQRLGIIILMITLNVFALLSVSRAYLLGLGSIAFCILLGLFTQNWKGTLKYILVIGIIVAFVIYIYNDELMNIVASFQYRFNMHAENDGRTAIWLSSLRYLRDDLHAILIGRGVYNYTIIGTKLGELFSMSSHNVYIDCIMAFGVVGSVCLFAIYSNFASRCRQFFCTKPNIITMMPFIMLSVYYMTSGSFRYQKTWIYYMMTIYFMYSFANGEVTYDT